MRISDARVGLVLNSGAIRGFLCMGRMGCMGRDFYPWGVGKQHCRLDRRMCLMLRHRWIEYGLTFKYFRRRMSGSVPPGTYLNALTFAPMWVGGWEGYASAQHQRFSALHQRLSALHHLLSARHYSPLLTVMIARHCCSIQLRGGSFHRAITCSSIHVFCQLARP